MSDPKFNKITPDIYEALKDIVGDKNIFTKKFDLEPYSHDETEDLVFYPEIAVLPSSTKDISEIMSLCYENSIPVTTRGGGTGLSGGALPVYGGVILSTERLDKIIEGILHHRRQYSRMRGRAEGIEIRCHQGLRLRIDLCPSRRTGIQNRRQAFEECFGI